MARSRPRPTVDGPRGLRSDPGRNRRTRRRPLPGVARRGGTDAGGFDSELVELVPDGRIVWRWGFVGSQRREGPAFDSLSDDHAARRWRRFHQTRSRPRTTERDRCRIATSGRRCRARLGKTSSAGSTLSSADSKRNNGQEWTGQSSEREGRMRRLIVNEWISLDGVVQAPSYPDEDTDGGFVHGGWHTPAQAPTQHGSGWRCRRSSSPTLNGHRTGAFTKLASSCTILSLTDGHREFSGAIVTCP
jgi:hypothetical protein